MERVRIAALDAYDGAHWATTAEFLRVGAELPGDPLAVGDPETSVREVSLYLDLRYDCIDSASGEPSHTVTKSGFYDSQRGGSTAATYSIWSDCSNGYAENISGRVRASATDSQGAVGWSSWVGIYISPF